MSENLTITLNPIIDNIQLFNFNSFSCDLSKIFNSKYDLFMEEYEYYKKLGMKKLAKNSIIKGLGNILSDNGLKLIEFARPVIFNKKIFSDKLNGKFQYRTEREGILNEFDPGTNNFKRNSNKEFQVYGIKEYPHPIPIQTLRQFPIKQIDKTVILSEKIDQFPQYTVNEIRKVKPVPDPYLVLKIDSLTEFVLHHNGSENIESNISDFKYKYEEDVIPSGYKLTRGIALLEWK